MSPQDLATRVGDSLFAVDRASKELLQMQLVRCEPGRAVIRMQVREAMLNGHQICHGGLIFTLADSTFAFACNSQNSNAVAVACTIDFIAMARSGDTLSASAAVRQQGARLGLYDIEVSNQHGVTVALFRGKSYRVKGDVLSGMQAE